MTTTTTTPQDINAIIAAGGNRWTKYGKDRIYIDPEKLIKIFGGHTTNRFVHIGESGVISRGAKLYYDIQTGEWVATGRMNNLLECALGYIIEHFAVKIEPTEAAAVVAEAEEITRTAPRTTGRATRRPADTDGWTTATCRVCGGPISREDAAMASVPGVHFDCN